MNNIAVSQNGIGILDQNETGDNSSRVIFLLNSQIYYGTYTNRLQVKPLTSTLDKLFFPQVQRWDNYTELISDSATLEYFASPRSEISYELQDISLPRYPKSTKTIKCRIIDKGKATFTGQLDDELIG